MAIGCSVDEAAFQARVFTCDTAARDPRCGTDRRRPADDLLPGQPARRHRLLHRSRAARADVAARPTARGLRAGQRQAARLQSRRHVDARRPCGRERSRLPAHRRHRRRRRLRDDAAVLDRQPTAPTPCARPARRPSSTSSTPRPEPSRTVLHSDHLYCLQRDCVKGGSSCGPGAIVPALAGRRRRRTRPTSASPTATSQRSLPAQPLLLQQAVGLGQPATSASPACSGSCASPTSTAWSASA